MELDPKCLGLKIYFGQDRCLMIYMKKLKNQ